MKRLAFVSLAATVLIGCQDVMEPNEVGQPSFSHGPGPTTSGEIILDFEDLAAPGPGFTAITNYSHDGFTLAGTFLSYHSGDPTFFRGSTSLIEPSGSVVLTKDGGGAFDLVSIDLVRHLFLVPLPVTVSFTGERADGSTESQTFTTNSLVFQPFIFSGFTNLTTVSFSLAPTSPPYQFDNISIVVDDAFNNPPVADAGPDQTVTLGETVHLDGGASSDPDTDPITSYSWEVVLAPAGVEVSLANASTVNPTFVPDVAGEYEVRLIVNDGTVDSNPDDVTIFVQPSGEAPQSPMEATQQVRSDLLALPATGDRRTDKKIEKAIKELDKSLNPAFWLPDETLHPKDGKKVFDHGRKAVKELAKVVKHGGPLAIDAQAAIDALIEIYRNLAQVAIDDAIDSGGKAKKIEKAQKEMTKAQREIDKGHFDHAVGKYKNAWKKAVKALR